MKLNSPVTVLALKYIGPWTQAFHFPTDLDLVSEAYELAFPLSLVPQRILLDHPTHLLLDHLTDLRPRAQAHSTISPPKLSFQYIINI